jgi:predicted PurR-regulated permease PerM
VSAQPRPAATSRVKQLFETARPKPRQDFRDLHFTRQDGSRRTAGPIVWIAVIVVTCVLLYLLQKVLLLVVPFLLALVLFYALFPIMARMVLWGMKRETAALTVILAFCVVVGALTATYLPRAIGALTDNQDTIRHYLDGGITLLQHTVGGLERRSNLIAQAHLSQALNDQLDHANGSFADRIQSVFVGLIAWGPSLALVPFLAFFLLRDSRHFKLFLSRAVPNAFFETTLFLLHGIDKAARAYFQGLIQLTILDTLTLAAGLFFIGIPGPLLLGFAAAVLAWIPYVGSLLGGILVALVAAADFSDDPSMTFYTIMLFVVVRLLDDFLYMPMTIGKSLHIHPLISVLMIFVGGELAGIPGLMLVLPLLGILLVVGETIGVMLTNPRLMARYRQGRTLRRFQASQGLAMPVVERRTR